jgi:hypothetical protein
MVRMTPAGERSDFAVLPVGTDGAPLRWLNGMAAADDGSIYYAENAAVRRIEPDGSITTLASAIEVPQCTRIPGWEPRLGPFLRGLAAGEAGSVYAAATGCGAVLRLDPDGGVRLVLRAEPPWSPTAVAVTAGGDLYVLEYLHPPAVVDREEWIPRVRRLSAAGRVELIATVERDAPAP